MKGLDEMDYKEKQYDESRFIEETIETKHIYKGNIINVESLTVKLPDGRTATRDKVSHPGATVIIPLTKNNEIYMVRQYRKAIEMVTLELPAGKLDEGEEPVKCAVRELKEETGLIAGKIKHIISIHSTPGFSNEVLHLYLAEDLEESQSAADEDEFIDTEKYSVEELKSMIAKGIITDAKSIIGVLAADDIIKNQWG
jgi:ADP-ribose pyrophosphatase